VDEVLVSVMDRGMTPVSRLANSVEGVKASGGANYFSFGHLHHLRDSLAKRKRIALVGVGCSVEGAYHIAARSKAYAESLKYKVGLFCSSQLDRDETVSLLLERGITPEKVETVNIRGGFVHVGLIGGGVVRTKLAEFEAAKRRGCAFCLNVENSCADLSIGEMGAPAGRVIVAVRTAAGEEAIRIAGDELELEEARGDVMSRARDVVLRKSKSLSDVRSSHPSD
jgi:coenzyme F420 hydrogenase subunit beta